MNIGLLLLQTSKAHKKIKAAVDVFQELCERKGQTLEEIVSGDGHSFLVMNVKGLWGSAKRLESYLSPYHKPNAPPAPGDQETWHEGASAMCGESQADLQLRALQLLCVHSDPS